MERPVSRGELHSPANSPEPASDPDLIEHIKETTRFEFVINDAVVDKDPPRENDGEDLDFRLFSSIKPVDATAATIIANRIRLRSPTPQNAEPGFLVPERARSHYFQDASSVSEERYQAAVLSGAEVLALSHKPCPGNAYP